MATNCGTIEKTLSYSIHRVSSYSPKYPPNGILEDNPNDLSSRWSSDTFITPQYLILKLIRSAIVTEIRFGKYKKNHLCNIKRFKVFGGLCEESMIELVDDCLNNDSIPETFRLKHQIMGNEFPCRYIKICPLQSWRPNFNFSIWFVELKGFDDCTLVKDGIKWLNEFRQRETIRLCLKHLRQKNYCEAFESLQKRTRVQLEDELLTKLHKLLVIDGNFESCERLLEEVSEQNLFDSYIRKQDYKPIWKRIIPTQKSQRPGMRGGHQMCIDSYSETIYLFGGWDGTQDLSDLWSYNIASGQWNCISKDTSLEGGPSARSCHKMCLDPIRKKIYTLGRYLDSIIRSVDNLKSDFYVYDIQTNKWSLICEDTSTKGGPQLVFDHQMCMDLEKNTIYVFGGRILSCTPSEDRSTNCPEQPLFSGLYIYEVTSNSWRKLREDCSSIGFRCAPNEIKSRIGHSMLFHQKLRLLYIFAGQRQKEYLSDFFTYNVDTDEIIVINDGDKTEVPAAGFTQRATIDPNSHEIHVLSGLNRDKDRNKDKDKDRDDDEEDEEKEETVKNSFWVYDIPDNRWSCIYRNESIANKNIDNNTNTNNSDPTSSTAVADRCEPCPRFAHQLVYDHLNKCHYLFGGNPGRNQCPKLRLDDFWTLELKRITNKDLLRKSKRLVREQAFREIIQTNSSFAISYLQNQLSETFNHSDPEESRNFQSLASLIFKDESSVALNRELDPDLNYMNRTKVFDTIVEFFPEHMTQPKGNLVDLVLV